VHRPSPTHTHTHTMCRAPALRDEQVAKAAISQWLAQGSSRKILCEPNSPHRKYIKLGSASVSTPMKLPLSDPVTPRGLRTSESSTIGGASLSVPPSSKRPGESHSRHPSRQRSIKELQERAEAAERMAAEQAKRANGAVVETERLRAELEGAPSLELITAELRAQLEIVGGSMEEVLSKACFQLGVEPSASAARSLRECHAKVFGPEGVDLLEVSATTHPGEEMPFCTTGGQVFRVIVPPGVSRGSRFKLQIPSRLLSPRTPSALADRYSDGASNDSTERLEADRQARPSRADDTSARELEDKLEKLQSHVRDLKRFGLSERAHAAVPEMRRLQELVNAARVADAETMSAQPTSC